MLFQKEFILWDICIKEELNNLKNDKFIINQDKVKKRLKHDKKENNTVAKKLFLRIIH
jgi:hypothetical protein